MKTIKKVTILLLTFCILFSSCIPVQAASNKTKAKNTVTGFYKAAKKSSRSKMDKYMSKKTYNVSSTKSMFQLIKPYNKKLSYRVTSVKIKGKKATVKVKVTYRSLRKAYNRAWMDSIFYSMGHENASDQELLDYLFARTKVYAKSTKVPKVKTTAKVYLKKKNGKWKITSLSKSASNSIYCDFVKAADDLVEAFEE